MKIEDKNALYLSHLKLLYELSVQKQDDVDINYVVKSFLQRKSMDLKVSQSELIGRLTVATTVAKRKIVTTLLMIEEEIEKEMLEQGINLDSTNQYRYSLANIQVFYDKFANRKISRQALNKQKNSILPLKQLPNEYASVLENELLEYFYLQTGVKLDVDLIRPMAYKKPLQDSHKL
ncbi:hypothetical protein ACSX1A_00520 [Pontibacter sp. MBLB2868]|uniref:hypothetical protein n=1 Tax=Pontibacter sp. MBLB2868 TaxID=3451555 RepID=UPI003F7515F9